MPGGWKKQSSTSQVCIYKTFWLMDMGMDTRWSQNQSPDCEIGSLGVVGPASAAVGGVSGKKRVRTQQVGVRGEQGGTVKESR